MPNPPGPTGFPPRAPYLVTARAPTFEREPVDFPMPIVELETRPVDELPPELPPELPAAPSLVPLAIGAVAVASILTIGAVAIVIAVKR